eukprot:GHVS01071416.1.p1 GENE.GHVS01071416.1~~GHVS01071416.1.p1  ORF type:complete len:149 (-),score=10.48 GHVS01071416.1:294-740(-)
MNGCSKRRSHKALLPALELQQQFPKLQYFQAQFCVAKIKTSTGQRDQLHPCMRTWAKFKQCCVRFNDTSEKRCVVEASLHHKCLGDNKEWRPPGKMPYMKILEHFRIFNDQYGYRYPHTPLAVAARGSAFRFGGEQTLTESKPVARPL